MASNRAQRRAAKRNGKRPGETYADQLAREKMIKEAVERTAHDESVALESDIKTQRFLWMAVVANHIAFGHAGVRAQRFMMTLDDVREDLEKMAKKNGWEYAIEKLREQCQKITGMEVRQIHEDRMIQARKENEAKGIFFDAENPEDLAAIGFTGARDTGPKWISVQERKPELIPCNAGTAYSEAVIVCTSGRKIMVAVWDGIDFLCDMDYWEAWGEIITHWMPTDWMLPLPVEDE